MELTPEKVQDIHLQGGTILGSSRGGWDLNKIMKSILDNKINQVRLKMSGITILI